MYSSVNNSLETLAVNVVCLAVGFIFGCIYEYARRRFTFRAQRQRICALLEDNSVLRHQLGTCRAELRSNTHDQVAR